MQNIGKNIKRIRTSRGITQEGLAEQMSITRQAISSWETGKTEPDTEAMTKMAEIFGCTLDEIIYGEEGNKSPNVNVNVGNVSENVKKGITFGSALAMVISYVNWHSVGWAIVHGLLSWAYVVYYWIVYA